MHSGSHVYKWTLFVSMSHTNAGKLTLLWSNLTTSFLEQVGRREYFTIWLHMLLLNPTQERATMWKEIFSPSTHQYTGATMHSKGFSVVGAEIHRQGWWVYTYTYMCILVVTVCTGRNKQSHHIYLTDHRHLMGSKCTQADIILRTAMHSESRECKRCSSFCMQ